MTTAVVVSLTTAYLQYFKEKGILGEAYLKRKPPWIAEFLRCAYVALMNAYGAYQTLGIELPSKQTVEFAQVALWAANEFTFPEIEEQRTTGTITKQEPALA
jgi:hypothetical protein